MYFDIPTLRLDGVPVFARRCKSGARYVGVEALPGEASVNNACYGVLTCSSRHVSILVLVRVPPRHRRRMIDMGFEEQVLAVLDAMGGTLKADDEELAYMQEMKAKQARNTKDLVSVLD